MILIFENWIFQMSLMKLRKAIGYLSSNGNKLVLQTNLSEFVEILQFEHR